MSSSGFFTFKDTWKKQQPYNLGKVVASNEKYVFISSAIRGSYRKNSNPWSNNNDYNKKYTWK